MKVDWLLYCTLWCLLQLLCNGKYTRKKSENDLSEDYMNDMSRPIDNEIYSVDNRIFSSGGKVGEALKQVYRYLATKLQQLTNRIQTVEEKASTILSRLSISDCSSLPPNSPSGVYTLYLDPKGAHAVRAFCQMDIDDGGWTVILQRNAHDDVSEALNFTRGIRDYKIGFGEPESDHWVGLENIHLLTNYRNYQLRIQLTDFNDTSAYAHYDLFYVGDEDQGYRLRVSGYSGDAGDAMGNNDLIDNFTADGMMFSTYDLDRDTSREINCSQYWAIGGWWFNRCSWANLMGPYKLPGTGEGIGINWHKWRNKEYIKSATMMIKPVR